MLRMVLLVAVFVTLVSPAEAKKSRQKAMRIGVGVVLFGPTGLSGHYFVARKRYVDIAFGLTSTELNVTYVLIQQNLRLGRTLNLPWYYGLGGRYKRDSSSQSTGARGSLGVLLRTRKPRLDSFAEVVSNLDIMGRAGLNFGIAAGTRYRF